MKRLLLALIIGLFVLTSCSNSDYQNAMDKGIESLGQKDYHQASVYFEIATREEDGESEATSYYEQATLMDDAIQAYEKNDLEVALESVNKVIVQPNVLNSMEKKAENLKDKIQSAIDERVVFEEKLNDVKHLFENENYHESNKELQVLEELIAANEALSIYQLDLENLKTKVELALSEIDQAENEEEKELASISEEETISEPAPEPDTKSESESEPEPEPETETEKEDIVYETYENGRFGFSFDYPANFEMAPPPTNGDGVRFYNTEFEITAYGGHTNILSQDETIETYYERDINEAPEDIAYQQKKDDWYVLSYEVSGMIVYKQFFFGENTFNSYTINYPGNKQEKYGPILTRISESFLPAPDLR
ncbi:hypothetical protein [Salipaludibacillus sp. CF4.18]|uniref:hypothetical protein n=1 Tax=Salipaludibacillus sp. CF4.18 TaxID=3373081 RepID=UPI003EE4C570